MFTNIISHILLLMTQIFVIICYTTHSHIIFLFTTMFCFFSLYFWRAYSRDQIVYKYFKMIDKGIFLLELTNVYKPNIKINGIIILLIIIDILRIYFYHKISSSFFKENKLKSNCHILRLEKYVLVSKSGIRDYDEHQILKSMNKINQLC